MSHLSLSAPRLPGAPTCTEGVLPARDISLSPVLQTQVLVLGGAQLHLTSHIKGAPVAARWCLPLVPPSVCTPVMQMYRQAEQGKGSRAYTSCWHSTSQTSPGASVGSSRDQAGNPDEGSTWAGWGVSWRRRWTSTAGSHVLGAGQLLPRGNVGLEVPDLAIFKETIEIWIFKCNNVASNKQLKKLLYT